MTILSQFSFKSLLITGLFSLAATIANGQSVISRAYHNTVARYNLYYNSKTLVEDARVKAAEAHKNNFKEVIDIFPYSDEAQLKGNAPNMDEVLKKLSTIIEKHSKSKWVDDSYLMMGKAQFFKGDFYAAIEVFEYVNSTYKGKPLTYEVDLWILKCYLMLNNIEDAEALYTKLKNQVNFPAKLKPELKLAGATIFIREKKYTSAIKLLEEVRPLIKKKEQKIRVNFAMGQIYQLLNMQDKSIERFSKVAKMNPPYDFAFNARLSMARAINPKNKSEIKQAKNSMKRMLRDDKNIDYFDRIYYELGNLEIIDKNPAEALVNYKLSLASKTSDATQKSNTYLAVAEIYFKSQNYEYAQLYYDSAARAISPEHPDYKVITQRNEILNDLIKHLVIIRTQDSLLKLSENEKLREKTIDKLIRAEKEKQILDKNKEENKAFISGTLPGQAGANAGSSTFPFYNQAARNKGYSDFLRIWGSRSLKDNWAFSSLQTIGNTDPSKDPDNSKDSDSSKVVENTLMLNAPEERKKYYEFIPVTKAQKDKARYSMWESYIMAANIYYQQLNEPEKAMKLLQELLSKYPGNSFEANAWYLLAKINKDKGNMAKWSEYKDLIEKNYPDSPFLSILNNTLEKQPDKPKVEENTSDKIVEANYRKMLEAYQNKQFEQARIIKAENDKTNAGSALQSRFDLLDALMTGEEGDYEAYKSKLQAIIDNYPDSEVSETAKNYLYALNKKLNVNSEDGNSQQSLYQYQSDAKLFYFLAIPNSPDGDKIKSNILQYNSTYNSNDNLQLTATFLDDKTQMIIVNNFADPAAAIHYLKGIATERSILQNTSISPEKGTHAVISQENFTKLLSDKKLDDYLQFYSKNYKI